MQLSPLQKLIAALFASLAIVGGLLFAFILVSRNVQSYRDTLGMTATSISSSEQNFNRLAKIQDLIKNRRSDIKRLENITINRKQPLQFIETIEKISHLTNTRVALAADEIKGNTESLLFRAAIEGNDKNVRTVLALIQSLPYQIKIDNLAFQRDVPRTANKGGQPTTDTITRLTLAMKVKTQ